MQLNLLERGKITAVDVHVDCFCRSHLELLLRAAQSVFPCLVVRGLEVGPLCCGCTSSLARV